ncbi:hypothetical protein [Syntrophomonas curvata]
MNRNRFKKHTRFLFILGLCMVLASIPCLPTWAEGESAPSIKAKAGYNGYVRTGELVSFKVEIENPGSEIKGTLKISSNQYGAQVVFSREVVLPSGSRKSFNLYVSDDQSQSFNLRLVSGGKEIASTRIRINRLPPQEMMLGVLSSNPAALNQLGALKLPGNAQRATVIHLDAQDLPTDPLMLESLDVLIMSDFSSRSLKTEQLSGIQSWVEGGGLLVSCGGASWEKTLSSLPPELVPVQNSGSIQVNRLPGLEKWTGQQLPAGSNIIITKGQARGATLMSSDNLPILVGAKMGRGNVYYLAFDPAAGPFENWVGNESLWLNIFTGSDPHQMISASNSRGMMMDRRHDMNWALRSIPASDLPSRGGLAAILLAYILILGPIVYLVLKKMDRRELGWVVIPLAALLLFSATYLVGFKGKGRDVFTRVISIVQMEPGLNNARVTSYIGAFAPTHRQYSINLAGNRLVDVLPIDSYRDRGMMVGTAQLPVMATVKQGKDTTVEFGDLSRWSTRSIQTRSSMYKPGNIEAELHTEGNRIKGTLTNNTSQTLNECTIYSRYGYQKLNKLKPGETVEVDLSLYMTVQSRPLYLRLFESYPIHYPPGYNPFRAESQSKMRVMEMYFNGGQDHDSDKLMFIGWSQEEVEGVMASHGAGKTYPSTAWLSPLPVELLYKDKISVPPGIINGRIIDVKANHCSQDLNGIQFGGGPVTFQLDIPYELSSMQVKKLTLLAPTDNFQTARGLAMELYNWSTGNWQEVKYQLMGNLIPDWQDYLSEQGSLRVRITPSGTDGFAYLKGVTLSMEAVYLDDAQQQAVTSSGGR